MNDLSLNPLAAYFELDRTLTDTAPISLKRAVFDTVEEFDGERRVGPLLAKGTLTLCGIAGRVAYFPQMQRLASGSNELGIFFKMISLPVYSTDYAWSSVRMVDEIRARQSSVPETALEVMHKVTSIGAPVILGIAAQLPLIALAYKYNPTNPAMVALTTMDAVMPIYSSYLMTSLWQKKVSTDAQLAKAEYLDKIETLKTELLSGKTDRLAILLEENTTQKVRSDELVRLLAALPRAPESEIPRARLEERIGEGIAIGSGIVLTLVFLAWLGAFTYEGAAHFYDNPGFDASLTVLTVLVNATLMGTLFIDTHKQMFRGVVDRYKGRYHPTYISEVASPGTAPILKVAAAAFVLFQSMAAIQISRDYLPEEYVIPNAIVLSLAFIIPAYLPVRELSDWAVRQILVNRGTPQQKQLVKLFGLLEALSTKLKYADESGFASRTTDRLAEVLIDEIE